MSSIANSAYAFFRAREEEPLANEALTLFIWASVFISLFPNTESGSNGLKYTSSEYPNIILRIAKQASFFTLRTQSPMKS